MVLTVDSAALNEKTTGRESDLRNSQNHYENHLEPSILVSTYLAVAYVSIGLDFSISLTTMTNGNRVI